MSKTALFVDFDNVYSGLRRIDETAAERFATDPRRWLTWLEGDGARRLIVRRCFMNPRAYHRYRPDFVRAAFSVVDCPPLTGQGKTSTDIYLVMAMLDALAELPHLDEFVVLSADADFTPVLLRLRAHDKRTAALAVGPASVAYTAAADVVYTEEAFIEEALGLDPDAPRARAGDRDGLLRQIADRARAVAGDGGALEGAALVPVLKEFPAFTPDSNWLGFHSLKGLAQALARSRDDLAVAGGDAWRLRVVPPGEGDAVEDAALRDRIVARVAEVVAASAEPVVLASAAHAVIQALGPAVKETGWAGAGSFLALLDAERSRLGLETATGTGSPGFVFDPARHQAPALDAPVTRLDGVGPELADFIRRMHAVTQAPSLSPEAYAAAFDAIAEAVEERPYHLSETSKLARDIVTDYGYSVPRSAIGFVLKGLAYRDFDFAADLDGEDIAEAYRDNVLHLAEGAQMDVGDRERAFLDDWLLGGFEEEDNPGDDDDDGLEEEDDPSDDPSDDGGADPPASDEDAG